METKQREDCITFALSIAWAGNKTILIMSLVHPIINLSSEFIYSQMRRAIVIGHNQYGIRDDGNFVCK
jgi:hypothetical protein